MGLFSFLNKNKQEAAGEDSAYVARDDDDAAGARARSKRASSAGEPAARRTKDGRAAVDPVLPEKKRARRRLVGAIALAMAVAIGLPMLLDSEHKPPVTDIDIRIPSKEKAAAMPVVPAADTLDQSEQIVEPSKATELPPLVTLPREDADVRPAVPEPEPKPEVKAKPELKLADKPAAKPPVKPAEKPAVKPAEKPAEKPPVKLADKPAEKPAEKPPVKLPDPKPPEPKPAEPKPAVKPEAERALAILEGKPVVAPANQKYIVQVAALASQEKAVELQSKLKAAGIPSFTQKGAGSLIRVKVGPFTREEGEIIRPKLVKLGLSSSAVPH